MGGEPGDDVIRGRILDSTCHQYGDMIIKLIIYLRAHHSACVQDDNVVLPLPTKVVKMFLQYTSIKRNKAGVALQPEKFNSYSHVNGYINAIKHLYKESTIHKVPE